MANIVDTNGWDTVAAISYKDVNDAIVRQGSAPQHFAQSAGDGSASVTGDFGQWALTTGGAGPDIMMALPVTGGTVTVGANSYPITPATATVLVRANFLPQPDNPARQLLQLQTKATLTAGEEAASVEDMQPAQPVFLANAALRQLLQDWLNAHLQEFNHTFAVVDFNAEFTREGMEWLRPSHTGYAVAEQAVGATLENSVFAVMCLIDGKTDTQGLVFQVSPYAIPTGRKAGFILSSEKFLQHMMLAAVPLMFKGIQDRPVTDYFRIDNDGTRIINIKPLNLLDTKLENGKTVKPTVKERLFSIEVNETELKISITGMEFEYSPGITVNLTYEGAATLSFDAVQRVLDLAVASQSGSGSVQVSEGIIIAEIVAGVTGIVLSVVGGLGGVVSRTANAAVRTATEAELGAAVAAGADAEAAAAAQVTCCCGLIAGTPQKITQIGATAFTIAKVAAVGGFLFASAWGIMEIVQAVAQKDYQSMPKITDLTDNAVGRAVIWPEGVPGYALASAGLNGSLQFGLDYQA
jgi:hypothetical protein